MSKTLFVNACVRPNSRTLDLARHVLGKLNADFEEVKLFDAGLTPVDAAAMAQRDAAFLTKDFSAADFDLARQFAGAETIVIAAPYWDLMFPAVLKTYFERITVNGLTFAYGQNGIPYSLTKATKLIYVTTSGGPIMFNFGYDYVAALAKGFFGIKDVQFVSAQGLDIHGADAAGIVRAAKDDFKE